jgi:cytochrome c-type biogenesis protein CcmH
MLFWIVAALLTLLACLAILVPVVRARGASGLDTDHDLEVYQDQLAELERDVGRGVIGRTEAEQARAEIGRRILRVAGPDSGTAPARSSQMGRIVATLAVLAVPLASWGIYAVTGSPNLPGQPLQARLDANPADSSIEELVARAEGHLAANPEDGRGWDVLAPIYYRMGRYNDAVVAYRSAIRLQGSSVTRELGLGEAIAANAGGTITTEAQAALERALVLEPQNPQAQFMLATAMAQEGKSAEASHAWRSMLAGLPADSPWRGAVEQSLARLGEQPAIPGPSADDVDAAALMSDKDRAQMIEDMVAGLDQRLRENPQDAEGWQRLVQSYVVLGRLEDARDALQRGLDALGRPSQPAASLETFASERGVTLDGQAE